MLTFWTSFTAVFCDFNITCTQGLWLLYKHRRQHQKSGNYRMNCFMIVLWIIETYLSLKVWFFSTNSPLDQTAVFKVHNIFLLVCLMHICAHFYHFWIRVQQPCVRLYSPAKAVLVVSHCFAVSGTSAQDLNLTPELAGLHEVCDVRHSKSTLTTV